VDECKPLHVGSATGVTGIAYIADTSIDGQYTMRFSGAASPADYQTALRGIYYWNNGPVNLAGAYTRPLPSST